MDKKYYIGIDMGTDSVGWAATDEEYNVIKLRNRDLWGSYLFEEAEGAANRRMFRTARRRTARVRQRILLLQSIFAKEVSKVDPLFFIRLNNSRLFVEDKDNRLTTDDAFFADPDFKDKQYYLAYPTIYHLRAVLISGEVKDIRLLYLAVHHLIKNRGHFLFEGQSFDVGNKNLVKEKFYYVNNILDETESPQLDLAKLNDVLALLGQSDLGRREKQNRLSDLMKTGKDRRLNSIVKAITGGNVSLKDLYGEDGDYGDIKSFSFEKPSFGEKDLPAIEEAVGIDNAEIIHALKAIYDWAVLCRIMGNEKYISIAKVKVYEKHKSDLAWLKKYVSDKFPEKYADVFRRREKKNNYAAYIGMDRRKAVKKCSRDEFYAFLKKELQITDGRVLSEMDKGDFMPKQVEVSNSVVPYQVNLYELEAILNNAGKYFHFLCENQGELTACQKIISLMTFRIPYYVGPLNTASKKFSWAVKNKGYENVSITPWNYSQAINEDRSEEAFISRMKNKCTYVMGEDVLPVNSLLYSQFVFLNELNNLKINGVKNEQARQAIYEYAQTHKKVTVKNCIKLLESRGIIPAGSTADIFSGIDGDFKASLSPWYDLRFLGDKINSHRDMCEQIIIWITLISDKSRLEKRIRREYGDILSDEEIKKFKGLNYSKWGRFSAKLLNGIVSPDCVDENGQCLTIIQAMRLKGENFMQLMSVKYGFQKAVDDYNAENIPSRGVTYNMVNDMRCSPSVKRAIWRTVTLVREICKIIGNPPRKIFIETAREVKDDSRKGKRTVSRKQQIIDLYKNIKDEERDWIEEIQSAPDMKFNSDKLILYYRQLGRSMYSGKVIPLDQVFNTNVCDIDHIYPQSKIKDDSLDNRVLVFKTENLAKGDRYPLSEDIRAKMRLFWLSLKEKGLISERKYERLSRNTPLSQDELADFINRQLVSTRQSTKEAAHILQKMLPETDIVYAKAGNAAAFKDKYGIIKVRDVNDLHHAKDAYINIVVGNVYDTKFNHNAAVYFSKNGISSYNIQHLYDGDIPGAWKVADIGRIVSTAKKNTCRAIRMTVDAKGALFDVNPVSAGTNAGLVPLKGSGALSDTSKYGGYNKATTAYFMLVRSKGKKNKKQLSLEAYPLYLEKQFNGSAQSKLSYCVKQGLSEPQIVLDHIKTNTLICVDGSYAWIRGKTDNNIILCNANQLILDENIMRIAKNVCNYMRDRKKFNNPSLSASDKIVAEDNIALYDALIEKLSSSVYSGLSVCKQAHFLKNSRNKFVAFSPEEQCIVLNETLHLMQCNSVLSDFTLLGGVAHAGVIRINKFIQDKRVKIIYQSPTGYYRKVINLSEFL